MRPPKCLLIVAAAAAGFSQWALADSPAARRSHEKELKEKCIAAANLLEAKPAGDIVSYGDEVGFDALVIKGKYPQLHMKKRPGLSLCLFDRRTRTAHMADADKLIEHSR